MRFPRRFAVVALLTPGLAGTLSSQDVAATLDIVNWPAPPFWSPPQTFQKETAPDAAESLSVEGALPTPPLPFVAITPCRIVDTRPASAFPAPYGAPALVAEATRDFDLNSAAHCPGIPATAGAYSLNVTVTETQGLGDIRIWPTGNFALVSTQNWPAAGLSLANAAIVPAGTGGSITVRAAGSGTHLIIDINGYYGDNFDSLYVNEGQASSVTSAMITDGTIINADINASAEIADTKLATIATAGKVADSALSSNVTKLGQSIEGSEIADETITDSDIADNAVADAEIADTTRVIQIPLTSFVDCESTGALLDFASGADNRPDFEGLGTNGAGFAITFDDAPGFEDQGSEICAQLRIPYDYAAGGVFHILAKKDAHTATNTEILNCAVGRNDLNMNPPGTVEISTAATAVVQCAPTLPVLNSITTARVYLSITSSGTMDDIVRLLSVSFEYASTR